MSALIVTSDERVSCGIFGLVLFKEFFVALIPILLRKDLVSTNENDINHSDVLKKRSGCIDRLSVPVLLFAGHNGSTIPKLIRFDRRPVLY